MPEKERLTIWLTNLMLAFHLLEKLLDTANWCMPASVLEGLFLAPGQAGKWLKHIEMSLE